MKLLQEMVRKDVILRSTLGKTVSAKGMIHVLAKLFDDNFKLQDVAPYVRSVNQALQDATNAEQAHQVWRRLHQELVHSNKRSLPDE